MSWYIDPDMPTMVMDSPLKEDHEIIAQCSSPERAKLVAAAPDLLEALERAKIIFTCLRPHVRQVMEEGSNAIEAAGLNPWCINEGLATGDEPMTFWFIDAAIEKAYGRH